VQQAKLALPTMLEIWQAKQVQKPGQARREVAGWSGQVAAGGWLEADLHAQEKGCWFGSGAVLIPKMMPVDRLWLVVLWVAVHMEIEFRQM
jgi:hypothetical protein